MRKAGTYRFFAVLAGLGLSILLLPGTSSAAKPESAKAVEVQCRDAELINVSIRPAEPASNGFLVTFESCCDPCFTVDWDEASDSASGLRRITVRSPQLHSVSPLVSEKISRLNKVLESKNNRNQKPAFSDIDELALLTNTGLSHIDIIEEDSPEPDSGRAISLRLMMDARDVGGMKLLQLDDKRVVSIQIPLHSPTALGPPAPPGSEFRIYQLSYADPIRVALILLGTKLLLPGQIQVYDNQLLNLSYNESNHTYSFGTVAGITDGSVKDPGSQGSAQSIDESLAAISRASFFAPLSQEQDISPFHIIAINADEATHKQVEAAINMLDRRPALIDLEICVCELSEKGARNLGTLLQGTQIAGGQILGEGAFNDVLGEEGAEGGFEAFSIGDLNRQHGLNIDMLLNTLVQDQSASILARTSVSTLDGKEATYFAGDSVPYIATPSNLSSAGVLSNPTVGFVNVGVSLRFVPRISVAANSRVEPESSIERNTRKAAAEKKGGADPSQAAGSSTGTTSDPDNTYSWSVDASAGTSSDPGSTYSWTVDASTGAQSYLSPNVEELYAQDYEDTQLLTIEVMPTISSVVGLIDVIPGVKAPQISNRHVRSTIQVLPEETFCLSGLIREQEIKTMRKFPILGDLPFLGKLFRNKDKRKERTEVIVFVTPHLRRVETDKNGNYIGIDEPSWNMYEDLEQR